MIIIKLGSLRVRTYVLLPLHLDKSTSSAQNPLTPCVKLSVATGLLFIHIWRLCTHLPSTTRWRIACNQLQLLDLCHIPLPDSWSDKLADLYNTPLHKLYHACTKVACCIVMRRCNFSNDLRYRQHLIDSLIFEEQTWSNQRSVASSSSGHFGSRILFLALSWLSFKLSHCCLSFSMRVIALMLGALFHCFCASPIRSLYFSVGLSSASWHSCFFSSGVKACCPLMSLAISGAGWTV